MSNLRALVEFEKKIGEIVTYKVPFYDKESGKNYDEYIQGILISVDSEKEVIFVEQHIPFVNLILKGETQTLSREIAITNIAIIR